MSARTSHKQMVDEIAEVAAEICSEWECGFIESMQAWTGEFTDKQRAVIERIYAKACESPY